MTMEQLADRAPAQQQELVGYKERWEQLYIRLGQREDYRGKPQRKIAFISTERSGSSLLCDALDHTGQFGIPDEYFSMKYIDTWARLNNIDPSKIEFDHYLDFLYRKATAANGVFSVKVHAYQHAQLKQQGVDIFDFGFDQVYKITRKDKVSQAFSFAKADLTKAWQSGDQPVAQADVSFMQVCHYLQVLADYDAYMAIHTDHRTHETIVYEDFVGPQQLEIFNRILAHNGCAPVAHLQSTLRQQSKPEDRARISAFVHWMGLSPAQTPAHTA